jgi:hypothetical protein
MDKKNIRYMVTCIRELGLRQIIDSQQGRNTFATVEEARIDLANVLKNNSVETLVSVYGPHCMGTFRISPIECWPGHNDPKGIYTDEVIE